MGLLSIGDTRDVRAKHMGTIISKITDDQGNEVEVSKQEERELIISVIIPDATQSLDIRIMQNRLRACSQLMNKASTEYWNFQKELMDGFKIVTKKAEIKNPEPPKQEENDDEPTNPVMNEKPQESEEQTIQYKVETKYDYEESSAIEDKLFASLEKAKLKLNQVLDHLVMNTAKYIKNILGSDGNPVEFKVTVNGKEVRRTWMSLDETEKKKVSKLIKDIIAGPIAEAITEGAELVETAF